MTTSNTAIVVNSYAGGGAERSSLLTASNWPQAETIVFVTCRAEGPFAASVPHWLPTAEIGTWPDPLRLLKFSQNLTSVAKSHGVRTLIVNGYGLNQMVLLSQALGLSQRSIVVVVERNTLSHKLKGRFRGRPLRWIVTRLTRWLYMRAHAIVGVSDGVSRDLETTLGLAAGSVTTIYNPVDTDFITQAIDSPIPKELDRAFGALPRPVVLTTGRLVTAKAHRDLLDAFTQLPKNQLGSLVILGEGPLRKDLEQQAERLGISDRIWMPGFVDNPWWFIFRSDVFALSSHWEGHPRAVLEALACGVPIASTDCPSGPREILGNARGTRLTPVGDSQALSAAISDLLANPDTRPSVDLSPYHPARVAKAYSEIVAGAIARGSMVDLDS